MIKPALFLLNLTLGSALWASDLNKVYQEGSQTATQHANQSIELLKSLNLDKFPGYQPHVSQEDYYQGVTQNGTALEADAQKPDELNQAVQDSINQLPHYQIDSQSENMQRLHRIVEHGNEIMSGEDAFCLDGDCSTHEYESSTDADFKKAIASLSAAAEASKEFDDNAQLIFKGQKMECSDDMAGFKNCCRDSGWGIDLNLSHCSDSEKQLGKAKENKLVVATGKYCYKRKRFPGGSICISTHKTYCVFQSKLARIVQVQGRYQQLHIDFGQGQYSNCSGLTPQQLQLVHFESIDFSEFYQDIQNRQKQPDVQQINTQISQRFKDFYQQGGVNG